MTIYLRLIAFNLLSAIFVLFLLPPMNAWYVGCFSLVFPLYCLKKYSNIRHSFFNGFFYGFFFYCAVFFWMPNAVSSITGFTYIVSLVMFIVIISAIASLYGVLFLCIQKFKISDWAIPFLWVLFEIFLLPILPISCGYFFHSSKFLIQTASIIGVYGLGLFLVFMNVAVVRYFTSEDKQSLVRVMVILFALVIFGYYNKASLANDSNDKSLSVVVLHTGILPIEKRTDPSKTFYTVMNQLQKSINLYPDAQLFVLPESIFVPTINDVVDLRLLEIKKIIRPGQAVILGCNMHHEDGIANSIVCINDDYPSSFQSYQKKHLLLFGEYMPLAKSLPSIYTLFANKNTFNDFVAGEEDRLLTFGEAKIAPGICFEHMFSFEIANAINKLRPNMIVNVCEDGWFGSKRASLLHLLMIKMRCVENGLAMVRAVNVGVSAYIGPDGTVLSTSDQGKTGLFGDNASEILKVEVPLLNGETFYCKYGYFLPYIFVLCFVLIFWLSKKSTSQKSL